MNLALLRDQPHLSVSSISDYLDCSLMFKFARVDKLVPEFKSDALVYGTAIHAALAEFYEELKTGQKMSVKQLQEIFETHWRRLAFEREDIQYKPDKDFETLLLEGKELLAVFHQKLPADEGEIIGIEEPFTFWLDDLPIPLIGVYDLVLEDSAGTITVVDHKPSSNAYANSEIDRNFQLTVYHLAARKNGFEDREILLRLDCLIKTKIPKFEQFYSTRTEIDEVKAVKKILAVWEGIQKGVFIPNDTSWKCSGCAFKNACENWFAGGGEHEQEK
jgi:putative RecB family exonuclease